LAICIAEDDCNPIGISPEANHAPTADNAARTALYKQIGETIMKAAVIIPIYNSSGLFVGSSSLKGLAFTVNAFVLFHAASM